MSTTDLSALFASLDENDSDPGARSALTRSEWLAGDISLLRADGSRVADRASRVALLGAMRDGAEVWLTMELVAYQQTPGKSNRNFVRFAEDNLEDLANSFEGQVFLRDHNEWRTAARIGTITSSRLERDGDTARIRMSVELTRPDAVADALRNLIDRFSIGWRNIADPECSLCEAPVRHCLWDKSHFRGSRHGDQVVEWILRGEGVETSAVNVPAEPNARRESIKHGGEALAENPPQQETSTVNIKELCRELDLPEDSTPGNVLAAIRKLRLDATSLRERVDTVEGELDAATRKLALATESAEAAAAALAADRADRIVTSAIEEGKITVGGHSEKILRELAVRDPKQAEEWVAEMARSTPVGEGLQANSGPIGPDQPSVLRADGTVDYETVGQQLSANDLAVAKRHGVTPAAYAERMWPTIKDRFIGVEGAA